MTTPAGHPTFIEGRVVHKKSNALQITFHDAAGDPFATGVQGVGDGKGKKLGMLLGFKNGGTGNHQLRYLDGATVAIGSKEGAPSVFTPGDGSPIATVQRGETSTALLPDHSEFISFAGDPLEDKTLELFRLVLATAAGEDLGRLDVIRRAAGWSLSRAADAAWAEYFWWDRAGGPLPVPVLGTRLTLHRPVLGLERDVLLGACVDMAIGLRPYCAAMN
jgi:hypothetical protein